MSIVLTHDVFCDGTDPSTGGPCPAWTHGATGQDGAAIARRIARSDGWARRRVEGKLRDLCPDCVADLDKARQA